MLQFIMLSTDSNVVGKQNVNFNVHMAQLFRPTLQNLRIEHSPMFNITNLYSLNQSR